MDKWWWEQFDTSRSGTSGDLSKLFRNEGVKQPGLLAAGAPRPEATLLAREVLQNSWDAARELADELEKGGEEPPEFEVEFRFRDLVGDEKAAVVDRLGLKELAARAKDHDKAALGLAHGDHLDQLDSEAALPVLEIRESATTGMYGAWSNPRSKLFMALVSIGFTEKASTGAGGSYGYGKAGLIRGSAIRTVVAYTCFAERDDDPEVTRRLLGMTYWGPHSDGPVSYNGFARFGDASGDAVAPLANEAADEVAASLGLDLRTPSVVEDMGTTFLVPVPTVTPEDLREAIERSWWPALSDNAFHVEIVDPSGNRLIPRPKTNPSLTAFIRAWEVARLKPDNEVRTERQVKFRAHTCTDGTSRELGSLGMVAEPDGWSYPTIQSTSDDETAVEHRSLVALLRGPKMIVEYLDVTGAVPHARGTFVADDDVDDLLRLTEPRAHDSWQTQIDADGIAPAAPDVAKVILRRVKTYVNEFRRSLKPPVPKPEDIRLPELDSLFRQILDGKGGDTTPPPGGTRDVSIEIRRQEPRLAPGSPGDIQLDAEIAFALSPNVEATEAKVRLEIRYLFIEDERAGDACPLSISAPDGFQPVEGSDGVFEGELSSTHVVFQITSEPYVSDWTGRLVASGGLVASEADAAGSVR